MTPKTTAAADVVAISEASCDECCCTAWMEVRRSYTPKVTLATRSVVTLVKRMIKTSLRLSEKSLKLTTSTPLASHSNVEGRSTYVIGGGAAF